MLPVVLRHGVPSCYIWRERRFAEGAGWLCFDKTGGNAMARKTGRTGVDRRKFLTGVAVTGAATAVTATGAIKPARAQEAGQAATRPSTAAAQRELATNAVHAPGTTPGTPGSDF